MFNYESQILEHRDILINDGFVSQTLWRELYTDYTYQHMPQHHLCHNQKAQTSQLISLLSAPAKLWQPIAHCQIILWFKCSANLLLQLLHQRLLCNLCSYFSFNIHFIIHFTLLQLIAYVLLYCHNDVTLHVYGSCHQYSESVLVQNRELPDQSSTAKCTATILHFIQFFGVHYLLTYYSEINDLHGYVSSKIRLKVPLYTKRSIYLVLDFYPILPQVGHQE